jgi:hypothetical protein
MEFVMQHELAFPEYQLRQWKDQEWRRGHLQEDPKKSYEFPSAYVDESVTAFSPTLPNLR